MNTTNTTTTDLTRSLANHTAKADEVAKRAADYRAFVTMRLVRATNVLPKLASFLKKHHVTLVGVDSASVTGCTEDLGRNRELTTITDDSKLRVELRCTTKKNYVNDDAATRFTDGVEKAAATEGFQMQLNAFSFTASHRRENNEDDSHRAIVTLWL